MTKVMKILYAVGMVFIGLGVTCFGSGYGIGSIMREMGVYK